MRAKRRSCAQTQPSTVRVQSPGASVALQTPKTPRCLLGRCVVQHGIAFGIVAGGKMVGIRLPLHTQDRFLVYTPLSLLIVKLAGEFLASRSKMTA